MVLIVFKLILKILWNQYKILIKGFKFKTKRCKMWKRKINQWGDLYGRKSYNKRDYWKSKKEQKMARCKNNTKIVGIILLSMKKIGYDTNGCI